MVDQQAQIRNFIQQTWKVILIMMVLIQLVLMKYQVVNLQ